ncbi:uncharacterized protein LOC124483259 isoform X2 [Hypomesus transpacificus]|uniref:uncharacterized protein LOC124483259 isoform X2 n=1 Tax=Hypomesus transpacificus TaxID=137520 RepID=UPI001F082F67|nr:uncharacterized protein LOC124483259 isoform X2 [Hypomesus transpacificus]
MTEAEPLLQVLVGGRPVEMMIDTGAAYSCISAREASHLPRSGELIKTVGFSGLTQLLPMTTPTEIKIDKKTLLLPLVVSEKTPLNLLGRDVLCQLNCILSCTTQHGVMIDRPVPQMMQQLSNEATVFWLGGIRTALESMTSGWTQELESLIPYAHPPTLDYHCTLQYFPTVDCERNDKWLKQQPRTVPIIMRDIFIGPEGAAVAVEETPYEASQHTIKDSLPHVTLLINPGHRARDLGPMVAEASKLKWLPTDRPQVWQTEGEKYFKLRAKAEGLSVPQVVRLPETRPKEMTVEERWTQMLSRVPPELWSAHETDVGLIKSAQPVQVTLKPGCRPPRVRQYPLKKETEAGIEPIIKGLLLAGVLIHSRSPANTPICPVRKADRSKYRLVHDLRALNDVVQELEAVVPNPHTLLTNVPATSKYYTVVDLTSAFFSVPLAEESRDLFAFTYKGQKLTYTRVPQGYIHSPHWFNQALKRDLADIGEQITSTLIMYVDDLALCSNSLEECHRDSMTLLTALAKKGHKASQEKLQYCQPKVQYLSRTLGAGTKGISPCHLLGISQAPKPQSVGDLMTFLGLTGYSAEWVNEYTAVVAPLRAMMKEAGVTSLQAKVKWTEEGERAFTQIKLSLQQAPALALPDYEKPFFLYVSNRTHHATAMLTQATEEGHRQPIAYYSCGLTPVEAALPPCYQGLAAIHHMYEKASTLTMGYPITIYTHHKIANLVERGKFLLTEARIRSYVTMLRYPDVSIKTCTTVNPANTIPLPEEGTPHDCETETSEYVKLRADLASGPLGMPDLTLFVDGSCFREPDGLKAGYAVVAMTGKEGFATQKAEVSKIHQAIHQQEETRGAAAAGAGPGRHQSPTW